MSKRPKKRKWNRLPEYDYSETGYYFITSCVADMKSCLGKVLGNNCRLNVYGKIVKEEWSNLKSKYDFVDLDEFIVMPNHFHGIIIIDKTILIETAYELSPQCDYSNKNGNDSTKTKSLSQLVGEFKMRSSRLIHQAGLMSFKWQRSFYDRIIRNEKELYFIQKYIQNNPLKWELDKGTPENLDL